MTKYYLGVDVSKGYADFIIIDENKKIVENSFQLDDTFTGHNRLYSILKEFIEAHTGAIIYSAVESTGGYENNWYNSLHKFQKDLNLKVSRLNPSGVNFNSKAELKRITTDKISAMSIAEYLIDHSQKVSYEQQDYFYSLRKQWKFVRLLVKQRTQLYNQLESVIYISNPEILSYCKDGMAQWVLKLLRQYPTAKMLSRAKAASLAKIPYVSLDRAKELIARAKESVASSGDEVTANLIISIVEQILNLNKVIASQETLIAQSCNLAEVELLKSFKGIGDYTAIGLILEIGAIERFKSVKHLASYFGLHPVFKQSGDKSWGMHMSKQGRVEARYLLFNVVKSSITYNPRIKELYASYIQRGKQPIAAMGMIMHKILRIVYGMLKNNETFNPEKDRLNNDSQQSKSSKSQLADDKTRRYQSLDDKAPVSRKQNKKRKGVSQNDGKSLSAGS